VKKHHLSDLESRGRWRLRQRLPDFAAATVVAAAGAALVLVAMGVVLASVKVLLSVLVPPLPSGAEVKVKLLCMFSNLFKAKSKFPCTCKKKNDGAGGI
jgi:hypothetical protein